MENVSNVHFIKVLGKICTPQFRMIIKLRHCKTNKVACASGEDLNQPGHLPKLTSKIA